MSFHVNKKKKKDGTTYWRLLKSEWARNKVTYKHVPVSDLLQYGLSPSMHIEDARARVKQLNAQDRLDRDAGRKKAGALAHQKKQEKLSSAHLPTRWTKEFVSSYLKEEMDIGPNGPKKYKKALSQWESAKRLIVAVNLPQSQWYQHRRRFYNQIQKARISPSYVGKVLRVLNLWGAFVALKTATSFIQVTAPRGSDRQMIADAYRKSGKTSKTSAALTPELLESAKGRLPEAQWRWLYLSLWLGLRPSELDRIKDAVVGRDENGTPTLEVYQEKLTGSNVSYEDRTKIITLVYPEQRTCLKMLMKEIQKPLTKTVRKHVLQGATLYGGRKGFMDLMMGRGQPPLAISQWLGHADLTTTLKHYKQRKIIHYKKVS